ncbi:transcription/translation regulatory transformer protein RfaH [Microbulbifer sp. TYP-18]|uniref:transcription/translation regulatory transformer protein RfaH n=1 Tax=Microbulbifer sp. TYP-18 TaxID=3230024 RepID=UPI0034C6DB2A
MGRWYLLGCKRQLEQQAANFLENQNHKIYLPMISVNRSKTLTPKMKKEPLFPGYMFIWLNSDEVNWTAIRSTRGVRDFVRFGQSLATVGIEVVENIKQRIMVDSASKPMTAKDLKAGDKVAIATGSFEGVDAIFQCSRGNDRVIVLINMIGSLHQVNVSVDSLRLSTA